MLVTIAIISSCITLGDQATCETTTDLSFVQNVKPLLDGRCKSCHTGYHSDDNIYNYQGAVDNYYVAEKNDDEGIKPQVVQGLMPKFSEMAECEIDIIVNWGDEGFPP